MDRLSDIPSQWTEVLLQARQPASAPGARDSQQVLWAIYGPAIRRYLSGAIREPQDIDNIMQELALRLAEGRFANLDRSRGQFRTYLKRTLHNLVRDHFERKNRSPRIFEHDSPEPTVSDSVPDLEHEAMIGHLRREILLRCWGELQDYERAKHKPYFTVLNYRLEHPEVPAREMGQQLAEVLGGPKDEQQIRKLLYRARRRFAHLIIDAVEQTLDRPSFAELEAEILDLGLHEFVARPLAERRTPGEQESSGG